MRALTKDEVECRIGTIAKSGKSLTLLLYKDARADMRILDEEFGPEAWQCRYSEHKGTLFCSVGVQTDTGWVWKEDAGAPSNMEKEKGEASDAFKRACTRWGIGRELYTAPEIRVWNGTGCTITQDGSKFVCWDRFEVAEMEVSDGRITGLRIVNSETGDSVFGWGTVGGPESPSKGRKGKGAAKEPQEDHLEPLRRLFPRYCAARHLGADEAMAEICRAAGIESFSDIAVDFVPDVERIMLGVLEAVS